MNRHHAPGNATFTPERLTTSAFVVEAAYLMESARDRAPPAEYPTGHRMKT